MTGTTVLYIAHPEQRIGLRQLCRLGSLAPSVACALVAEGVIEPANPTARPLRWRFSLASVERARIAAQLSRDLGVNLAGAALAVDLLEHIRRLEARLCRLEQQSDPGL